MNRQFMKIKKVSGSVTAAAGFVASGIRAGIKKVQKRDLALVASDTPCRAAAVFTSNRVKAAPVLFDLAQIRTTPIHGVVTNSGNANACTGRAGLANAARTAALVARAFDAKFGRKGSRFLVCSTGRIGVQLPMGRLEAAIPALVGALRTRGDDRAARAIMTSDTFPKKTAVQFRIGRHTVRVGGICKGAGMIHPRMNAGGSPLHATMLCTITTDVAAPRGLLQKSLESAVEQSFNSISVDGDTSTNDTVFLLANGKAGNAPLRSGTAAHRLFQAALDRVTLELARMIVLDGEGTSRFVTVRIRGCRSARDAERAGRAVINSMLIKSAWSGGDPNWGRLMDAIGYSGAVLCERRVRIHYGPHELVRGGCQNDAQVVGAKKVVKTPFFEVTIDLGSGKHARTFYTTDLTEKYVTYNKTE